MYTHTHILLSDDSVLRIVQNNSMFRVYYCLNREPSGPLQLSWRWLNEYRYGTYLWSNNPQHCFVFQTRAEAEAGVAGFRLECSDAEILISSDRITRINAT